MLAKRENFDVFNALDLMENRYSIQIHASQNLVTQSRLERVRFVRYYIFFSFSEFLEKLKFGIGDGNLQ